MSLSQRVKKAVKKFIFDGPDSRKRVIVKLFRVKPKYYTDEEKKELIRKMTEANRSQNRSLEGLDEAFLSGLDISSVTLPSASGYLLKKKGNPEDRIVYYIHGGGFSGSCTRDRMPFISYVVKNFGYNVFSLDYRLAPEYMFPCAPDDCLDGWKYLLESYESRNIVLAGESAGGNLVLALSLFLRDRKLPLPAAVYSNSPVTQFDEYTESYRLFSLKKDFIVTEGIIDNLRDIYYRKEDMNNPYCAPLHASDFSSLPPVFITAGESECLRDDGVMMAEGLKAAGNECTLKLYPGLCHAFIISPQMERVVKTAYPDFREFLDKYLK